MQGGAGLLSERVGASPAGVRAKMGGRGSIAGIECGGLAYRAPVLGGNAGSARVEEDGRGPTMVGERGECPCLAILGHEKRRLSLCAGGGRDAPARGVEDGARERAIVEVVGGSEKGLGGWFERQSEEGEGGGPEI